MGLNGNARKSVRACGTRYGREQEADQRHGAEDAAKHKTRIIPNRIFFCLVLVTFHLQSLSRYSNRRCTQQCSEISML